MKQRWGGWGLAAALSLAACGGDSGSPFLGLGSSPREGFSKLALLPNGSWLVIPDAYELEPGYGFDSLFGTLLDGDREPVCFYDIGGNTSEYVDEYESMTATWSRWDPSPAFTGTTGFRYAWSSSNGEGAWVATFPELGPANWVCSGMLRDEFVALMLTYGPHWDGEEPPSE